jgi:uncharacterized protein YecT (DUF1311 family)
MTKLPWLAALVLVLVAPAPAAADTETDVATLEQCLGPIGAEANRNDRDCVGAISEPCQDALTNATTVAAAECLLNERDAWDVLLNRYYEELRKAESDPARSTLRQAQRLWITFRDADCDFAYQQFEGGTIRQLTAADCLRDRTATRVLQLRDYLSWTR